MARPVLSTLALAGAAFVACQVYDPSLLTGGGGAAGRGAGGSGAEPATGGATSGGNGVGGTAVGGAGAGGTASGATGGGGSTSFEAGAGGEGDEPAGGTAGVGGSLAGASGKGGAGGASGGVAGSAGGSGKGGGSGTAGAGGASGAAGTTASGGAGTGAGGAGAGGAGAGAGGGSGTAGSGGSGPTEVELVGTATADSSEATASQMHPAIHGNDGDLVTRWCAANGNANHYWTVDLGSVHEVTRFEVTWEYPTQAVGLPYLYRIDVSSDGTTFTTAINKTANVEVTPTQSVTFPAGTMARHVRIVITGLPMGSQAAWASFYEASVFGY